jgi:hypothetical protein
MASGNDSESESGPSNNKTDESIVLDETSPYNSMTNEALYFLHASGFDPEVPDMDLVKDLMETKRRGKQRLYERRVQARTGMSPDEVSQGIVRRWARELFGMEPIVEDQSKNSTGEAQ